MKREISFWKVHPNEAMKYKFMCLILKYLFKRTSNKNQEPPASLDYPEEVIVVYNSIKKSGVDILVFNPEFCTLSIERRQL